MGNFKQGMKDGQINALFSNGDRFKGTFKDDKMRQGTYTLKNGDQFTGEFKNNLPFGSGILITKKGGYEAVFDSSFTLNGPVKL